MPIPGATAVQNITGDVQGIVERTRNKFINDSTDCCSYKYQILDTYCATQPAVCIYCKCVYRNILAFSVP